MDSLQAEPKCLRAGLCRSSDYIAATFEVATQQIEIYVNGVETESFTEDDQPVNQLSDSSTPVRIGSYVPSSGVATAFWDGGIDELTMYNWALGASEILGIFNAGSAGKCNDQQLPDIAITSAQLINATTIEYTYSIDGNPGDFHVGLYRSTDDQFNAAEDELVKLKSVTPLASGQTTAEIDFNGPLAVDPEKPFLIVVADPGGNLAETDEDNNTDAFLRPGIVWINRDQSDNFGVYGANGILAREIVDRAIDDWEHVIEDFDYDDDTNPFTDNTYELAFVAFDLQADPDSFPALPEQCQKAFNSGVRGITCYEKVRDDKPQAAVIGLDADSPWYFDPVPSNDTEFTTLRSPFAAESSFVSGLDLYWAVAHEIGHAVGLTNHMDSRLGAQLVENPGTDLRTFKVSCLGIIPCAPGETETTVTFDDFHIYNGDSVNGLPTHPFDLMNGEIKHSQRRLISDLNAQVLRNACRCL